MPEQINFNEKRSVPAPPPVASDANSGFTEVNIRTMASDLESLGSGTAPQVKRIAIPTRASAARQIPHPSFEGTAFPSGNPQTAAPKKKIRFARWFVIFTAAAGGLFLIGYYLLPIIFPPPATPAEPSAGAGLPAVPAPQGANLPAATSLGGSSSPSSGIVHQSFFRTPADQAFAFAMAAARGASGTEMYRNGLSQVLKDASAPPPSGAAAIFFEIAVEDANGNAREWSDFASQIGIIAYDPGFMQTNFKPDFTAFVYKDKNGYWPGYIIQANSSKNPLFLAPTVMRIESSLSSIQNFFLAAPGNPSGNFKDAEVSGQPVRTLAFKTPLGAAFTYGWFFNKYLIMSTSLEGLRQAVTHL